jgi:hypothetical protein
MHGGVNNLAAILFFTPIVFVWLVGVSKIKSLYYYGFPLLMLVIGWILFINDF